MKKLVVIFLSLLLLAMTTGCVGRKPIESIVISHNGKPIVEYKGEELEITGSAEISMGATRTITMTLDDDVYTGDATAALAATNTCSGGLITFTVDPIDNIYLENEEYTREELLQLPRYYLLDYSGGRTIRITVCFPLNALRTDVVKVIYTFVNK